MIGLFIQPVFEQHYVNLVLYSLKLLASYLYWSLNTGSHLNGAETVLSFVVKHIGSG